MMQPDETGAPDAARAVPDLRTYLSQLDTTQRPGPRAEPRSEPPPPRSEAPTALDDELKVILRRYVLLVSATATFAFLVATTLIFIWKQ